MTDQQLLEAIRTAGHLNWNKHLDIWQDAFNRYLAANPRQSLSGVKCKPCRNRVLHWLSTTVNNAR